jgi:DNA invertase Pin-like site-specific DNA recombinase
MRDELGWHRAKLTLKQVREIRRILEYERIPYAALARRFGVSVLTIAQIANYWTWRGPKTPASERSPTQCGDADPEAIRDLGKVHPNES